MIETLVFPGLLRGETATSRPLLPVEPSCANIYSKRLLHFVSMHSEAGLVFTLFYRPAGDRV